MSDLFGSKRVIAVIAQLILVALKDRLPIEIDEATLVAILTAITSWVIGDSIRPVADVPDVSYPILKSKRFWMAVGTIIAVVAKDRLGIPITDEQSMQIALLIGGLIIGDSLRSIAPKV